MEKTTILVGRYPERHILLNHFKSDAAEFIALYGRRRVGKTFLVKNVFHEQNAIFVHITGTKDALMKEQIHDFIQVIEDVFYQNGIVLQPPQNWKGVFKLLTKIIEREVENKKVILFFDELPWLASKRSRFIQALDYYWNRYWCDINNLKLIVCGSAASWMIENVISHQGGLHNRVTGHIPLYPFNLEETKAFLQSKGIHYNHQQILETFMMTGGIPYYLNFLQKGLSVPQNIDTLCFQSKGLLVTEFQRLYASLFKHSEAYEELIRIIATKRSGIERTEILKKSKLSTDGGTLKSKLNALEQSGFIVSFVPYGFKRKGSFYRVIDEYSLFYLKWIEPSLTNIRKLDQTKGYWLDKYNTPEYHAWAGYAFESVCFKHLAQIRKVLDITASAKVGSWHYAPKAKSNESGAQVDLLFDRNDGVITLCEIKYTTQPFALTKEEAKQLQRKIDVFVKRTQTNKQIQVVFITNQPIKQTLYSEEMITSNVTLDDFIKNH